MSTSTEDQSWCHPDCTDKDGYTWTWSDDKDGYVCHEHEHERIYGKRGSDINEGCGLAGALGIIFGR